jgi:segregation and condensation protein B
MSDDRLSEDSLSEDRLGEDRFELLRLLEAVLFASAEPLTEKVLASRLPEGTDVPGLLTELKDLYANRGVHLMQYEDRWAFRTAPDVAPRLQIEQKVVRKLTRAAVETLAIVAYHQPVTRAEIEEIRGVVISKGTLDHLLEAGWIKPKGRRQTPGRPVTWVTTESFLEFFGLESTEALPGVEELRAAGLLDARAGISTLGTQADAAGRGVPPDDDGEEDAAAEELRGEAADAGYEEEVLARMGESETPAEAASEPTEDADEDDESDFEDDDDDDGEDEDGEGEAAAESDEASDEESDEEDEDGKLVARETPQ